MLCKNCGMEMDEGLLNCPGCGTSVLNDEAPELSAQEQPVQEPVAEQIPEKTQQEQAQTDGFAQEVVEEEPAGDAAEELTEETVGDVAEDTTEETAEEVPEAATEETTEEAVEEEIAEEEKPRKRKKGLLIAAIAIVAAAAIGVGGWFGFRLVKNIKAYDRAVCLTNEKKYEEALTVFKSLGDFRNAPAFVQELTALKKEYSDAKALLANEQFAEAKKAFLNMGLYADSEQFPKYIDARVAMTQAKTAEEYIAAAEQFGALGAFEDSATMESGCYLQATHILIEDGQGDQVQQYVDKLNEEDKTVFTDTYRDAEVLETWVDALKKRAEMDKRVKKKGYDFEDELELIKPLRKLSCQDLRLSELIKDYYSLVYQQQENVRNYNIISWISYFDLEQKRCKILDEVQEKYEFLKDEPDLKKRYIGKTEHFKKCVDIQGSLDQWYMNIDVKRENGKYYVEYTNNTKHDFKIEITMTYYYNNEKTGSTKLEAFEIKVGETKKIYLENKGRIDYVGLSYIFEEFL